MAIRWTYQSPEDEIKKTLLHRYFQCVSTHQTLDRYRLKDKSYPAELVREFIGHVTGLWRGFAVLTGANPSKADEIYKQKGISNKFKFAVKQFYTLSKQLKSSGVLSISKHPSKGRDYKNIGRNSGLGVGDEF